MRRMWLLALVALLFATPAMAAPKAIQVKKLDIVAPTVSAEGLIATGKTLVTYFNTGALNSNIVLTGFDVTGAQLWLRTIDSGSDEIATAETVDAAGIVITSNFRRIIEFVVLSQSRVFK